LQLCIAGMVHSTQWRQILAQNRDVAYPTSIRRPRRNIAMPIGMAKLEWCGYWKWKNFDDMIIGFDRIHERDGQTEKQTPHDG